MTSGIYGIRDLVDGKWYIGKTTKLNARKSQHFTALKFGCHNNRRLHADYKRYGKENFEFFVLEYVHPKMLDVRERAWMKFYKSLHKKRGYNTKRSIGLSQSESDRLIIDTIPALRQTHAANY